VGLAAVVGDERPRRPAGEQVAEHSHGECEQALGDPLREPARCLGEVIAEAHLALRFENSDSIGSLIRALVTSTGGRWLSRWRSGVMSLTPVSSSVPLSSRPQSPLSQNSTLPWCPRASSTTVSRSCPVLGPTSSYRDPLEVADHDQPHAPDELAVR
jgi:hypothetical protein